MVGHGSGHQGGSLGTNFIGAVSLGSERAAPVCGCMGAGLVSLSQLIGARMRTRL